MPSSSCLLQAVVLFSVVLLSCQHAAAQVFNITGSGSTRYLYDDHGRIRLFQGINRVQKGFPWYDSSLLDPSVAADLAAIGVSVVRVGFMWSGAEPANQQWNLTYYDTIKSIVLNLATHGIYSLLDVHQDGLSSLFCLYDGAPLWVIEKIKPRHPFPWPLQGSCNRPWALNELTEAAGQAYQGIYDNVEGMRDDFERFWEFSARYFANVPILGYEIMNEPFAGDVYKDPALLLPGVAGKQNLQRLYDVIQPAIRRGDSKHLVFYEPVTWGMVLNGKVVGSGFEHVPGGAENKATSVFSFHYYCWIMGPNVSSFVRTVCDKGLGQEVFRSVEADVSSIGGASFLTEFGADTCSPGEGNFTECMAVIDMCTERWVSWINWPYSDHDDLRGLGLSRTYVRALAGKPLNASFAHDSVTKRYSLCYVIDTDIAAPTEIYVDFPFYYPTGIKVQQTTNIQHAVQMDQHIVTVTPTGPKAGGQHACISIERV